MIPQRIIQAWFDKARNSGSDVMRWSDFLDAMQELKHTDTTAYTEHPVGFSDLPVYADDAEAADEGLTGGELYQTDTGEVRIKLPENL
jgi:hypothetical protein